MCPDCSPPKARPERGSVLPAHTYRPHQSVLVPTPGTQSDFQTDIAHYRGDHQAVTQSAAGLQVLS